MTSIIPNTRGINSFLFSPSFTSKGDLIFCPSRVKINFNVPIFENHASGETSNPEQVNSADHEEPLHSYESEEPNLKIKFDPSVLIQSKKQTFENDINAYYFLKELDTTFSDKTAARLDSILTSATKNSKASLSLRSEKCYSPVS